MIKFIAKKLILLSYPIFYLKHLFSANKAVRILIFHDVPSTAVNNFELLITNLKKDFDFITPVEFQAYLAGKHSLKRHSLLVTFDDGFLSSKQAADIVLKKFDIKAIFFICPDLVNLNTKEGGEMVVQFILGGSPSSLDIQEVELPMRQEHLMDLINDGHTIGSHSSKHQRLSSLKNPEALNYAISESKRKITHLLQTKVEDFAYPFGDVKSINRQSLDEIKKDFKYCYSGVRGINLSHENAYALRREPINLFDNLLYNKFICLGGLSWLYCCRRSKLEEMSR